MVKKTNQIKHPTKNELGVILSLYRQKRYKECLGEVKDRLKFFPNSADLLNFEGMAYTAV